MDRICNFVKYWIDLRIGFHSGGPFLVYVLKLCQCHQYFLLCVTLAWTKCLLCSPAHSTGFLSEAHKRGRL